VRAAAFEDRGWAIAQFVTPYKTWDYSRFDVACEVSANRKSVFLNWLFWCGHDFSEFGINEEQRGIMLRRLQECWTFNHIDIPLPGAEYWPPSYRLTYQVLEKV
jgi:hypothetical protein